MRLTDNLALHAALSSGRRVVPLFIVDPAIISSPRTGAPRVAFMLKGLRALAFLARYLAAIGQPARAVEMLGASLPLLQNWQFERMEGEELLAALKAHLAPDDFDTAWMRGSAFDLRTLATVVLEELEAEQCVRISAGDRFSPRQQPLIDALSKRELQVLRLVAEGLSNREIAEQLVVTVGTVKKHLNNVFAKLGAASRTQAVILAQELDLLP